MSKPDKNKPDTPNPDKRPVDPPGPPVNPPRPDKDDRPCHPNRKHA